jgi:FkbM family methyltransferase
MTRALKLTALAAVLIVAAGFYPPFRLGLLALLGRASLCPFAEATRSAWNLRHQTALKDRILAASRLLEKDPGGFHLWETPKGRYWIPRGSDWSLPWDLAEQERKIYGTGAVAVRAGDVVLDCGANVGVFVREALAAGARLVVAIEPAPENLECLRRNFSAEARAGRVVIYPKGVWDKEDVLPLNVDPENAAADSFVIRTKKAVEGPKLPLTTIDKLVAELKLARVDFIKFDIEGAEQRALTGARETLARHRPRLAISSYHRPDDPEKIPALVRAAWSGYRIQCGPCADVTTYIRPDVLYFY